MIQWAILHVVALVIVQVCIICVMPHFEPRKHLHHDIPAWVNNDALFFITLCCVERGRNQLCLPDVSESILAAGEYYHSHQYWYCRLMLLMPDHLHAIISFSTTEDMSQRMALFKAFTKKQTGVDWQRGFYDHRIRDYQNWQNKAHYIRENPIRAELIKEGDQWPYIWEPDAGIRNC